MNYTCKCELNEQDIRHIIADKFGCKPGNIFIRAEREYVLGGSTESIKATVKLEGKTCLGYVAQKGDL